MAKPLGLDKISGRTEAPESPLTMMPFAPSPTLTPYVRMFCIVEATTETIRSLLPDTTLTVAFRYAGSASLLEPAGAIALSNCAVSGLRTTARRMCTSAGGGVVVALLKEGCAGRFFARSPYELFGRTDRLDAWSPAEAVARASAAVVAAEGAAARVAVLGAFLEEIARPWAPDPMVVRSLAEIEDAAGSIRMSALARRIGSSQDALEKRFRRIVGATPKRYASIVRFRRAVESVAPGRSLTEVSTAAGYADQSHFIREFRQVTGEAPREFIAVGRYCSAFQNAKASSR